ncbi:MAG: COG1361 S-layer family protein [archaeon]
MRKGMIPIWVIVGLFVVAVATPLARAADVGFDSINYYPTPVKPGQWFDLWIHAKDNSSFLAQNVIFSLDLSDSESNRTNYPFSIGADDSLQKSIGNLLPNQSALIKYRIFVDKTALNGDYSITAKIGDNGVYFRSEKITISVVAQNPRLELIESPMAELVPGKPFELALSIKNTGNSKAVNILVGTIEDRTVTTTGVVVERLISVLGPTQDYISSVNTGETGIARLELVASGSAESKAYTIPIQLRWEDENGSAYSATRYVGVNVKVLPAVDVVVDSVKQNALNPNQFEVGFNIYNAGPAAAKNIVVELKSGSAEAVSDSKIFIGTLESDDSTTFKSTFTLASGAKPGSYPVEVAVHYRDPQFNESTASKSLAFSVSSQDQNSQSGGFPWLVAVIVVIIVVAAAFLIARKGKAKRK